MKSRVWRWARRFVVLFGLLGFAGVVVAISGVIPIKASSGHFAITEWFLQLSKRRSIATHTLGLDLPRLDEPWLVMKGAGHYETACRPCHGSPDHPRPRIAAAMLPPPPDLRPLSAARDPAALFYVIKHGIKFTGMPAWPTQRRDDEVHAMVAFLRVLPSLDSAGYRRLVYGDTVGREPIEPLQDLASDVAPPRAVIDSCARCHGVDGRGRGNAAFPKLAGQRREYLLRALTAYERDERHSGIMGPIAAGLTADEQRTVADFYSALTPTSQRAASVDATRIQRGHAIATAGIPNQEVPACQKCHGPDTQPRNAAYPKLAGQYAEYLALQLELFKRAQRGGSQYAHLMRRTARALTSEQMRDVAAYYAALHSQ